MSLRSEIIGTTVLMLARYYSNNELSALFNTVLQLKRGVIYDDKEQIKSYYEGEYNLIKVMRGDTI